MKFLFIYNSGNVPEDKQEENISDLWQWLDRLKTKGAIENVATQGGKTVSRSGSENYNGKIFAASIVEAQSLNAAIALTQDWPELAYGGRVQVLQQLTKF